MRALLSEGEGVELRILLQVGEARSHVEQNQGNRLRAEPPYERAAAGEPARLIHLAPAILEITERLRGDGDPDRPCDGRLRGFWRRRCCRDFRNLFGEFDRK